MYCIVYPYGLYTDLDYLGASINFDKNHTLLYCSYILLVYKPHNQVGNM
jgi:hypothetical protein